MEEYITANCAYPGHWAGQVERMKALGQLLVAATHAYTRARRLSFHVTSFIRLEGERIAALDEYWADDAPAPQWRQDMHLGCGIRPAGPVSGTRRPAQSRMRLHSPPISSTVTKNLPPKRANCDFHP